VWSPDSTRIASGSYDKTVQIWEATTGKHFFNYDGHLAGVYTVDWSSHANLVASGSDDKTVQIWNISTDAHVFTYHGHSNAVDAIAWSPDYGGPVCQALPYFLCSTIVLICQETGPEESRARFP